MIKPIYKTLINWYQVSDKPLPKWLARACERDPELREEQSFGEELTRALKKRPNDESPIEGDSMASRVLRQITEEDYLAEQEEAKAPAWGLWLRNAGTLAAALTVAFIGIRYVNTSDEASIGEGAVVAQLEGAAPDAGDLIELGDDWKNPLDQEIEYIVADAKGAIGFLASAFVPSSYLAEEDQA